MFLNENDQLTQNLQLISLGPSIEKKRSTSSRPATLSDNAAVQGLGIVHSARDSLGIVTPYGIASK